jgi:hypothetical protein
VLDNSHSGSHRWEKRERRWTRESTEWRVGLWGGVRKGKRS